MLSLSLTPRPQLLRSARVAHAVDAVRGVAAELIAQGAAPVVGDAPAGGRLRAVRGGALQRRLGRRPRPQDLRRTCCTVCACTVSLCLQEIPFDELKEIEGTRVSHLKILRKWIKTQQP